MPPRGRGGKFSKPTRGGGKRFSRDVQPVDRDGNPIGMWRDPEDIVPLSEEEEDESESESESDDDAGPSNANPEEMTREQRRAAAKARKEAAIARKLQVGAEPGDMPPTDSEEESDDGEMPANPNHTAKSRLQANGETEETDTTQQQQAQLSRREREAIEAQQARERYMKLHAEGKTDEARADLARLALVKERREAEKARKQAEKEEKEERDRVKAEQREREAKMRTAAMGSAKGKKMKK
ncbi:hypothetical protein AJ80_07425 [Polytolypa hystricis UAMH7299]|uniref:Casein kinase substrate phosphoprotein PP28 domain-containing protein n=1 Tax=Polytolypa hystricis (strain UAMH7299) TaxID=1447883 RepID=A0A2B7XNW5_POLH7|nr:hypothetical protein AJ80_07425 [Polytolypa hystricis UAMH7299]